MRLGYFTMPVYSVGRDGSQTLRQTAQALFSPSSEFHAPASRWAEHLTHACVKPTPPTRRFGHVLQFHDTNTIKLAHAQPGADASGGGRGKCRDVRPSGAGTLRDGDPAPAASTSGFEAIGNLISTEQDFCRGNRRHPRGMGASDQPHNIDFPDNRFQSDVRAHCRA